MRPLVTRILPSFKVAVLLLWLVPAAFPKLSYTEFAAAFTVSVSLPLAIPVIVIPSVTAVPLTETLLIATPEAVPPLTETVKSLASRAPLPLLELNTASENVTTTLLLFAPTTVE